MCIERIRVAQVNKTQSPVPRIAWWMALAMLLFCYYVSYSPFAAGTVCALSHTYAVVVGNEHTHTTTMPTCVFQLGNDMRPFDLFVCRIRLRAVVCLCVCVCGSGLTLSLSRTPPRLGHSCIHWRTMFVCMRVCERELGARCLLAVWWSCSALATDNFSCRFVIKQNRRIITKQSNNRT